MNPLSLNSVAKIFSHSVGCLFVLFRVSFAVQKLFFFNKAILFYFFFPTVQQGQKLLSLIRSHLFIFVFTVITLRGGSENRLLLFRSESGLCFPLRVL